MCSSRWTTRIIVTFVIVRPDSRQTNVAKLSGRSSRALYLILPGTVATLLFSVETTAKMRRRYFQGLAIAALTAIPVAWASLHAQKPASGPQTTVAQVDFVRDIQPILQGTCYECHGPKKTKAQLRLD